MAGGIDMHTSIIIAETAYEVEDATKARLKKAYGGFQTVNRVKIHTPNRGISLRIEDIQVKNEYPLTHCNKWRLFGNHGGIEGTSSIL